MGRRTSFRGRLAVAALVSLAAAGCTKPVLSGLDPPSGAARMLVLSQSPDAFASSVVWDAGTTNEKIIPGGFLGGYMFSVPPGASLGTHPVALQNAAGRSATVDFTVTAAVPFGAPRIDAVTLLDSSFSGAQVTPLLYVQGANFDVGAVVQIAGADQASIAHRAIRNNLYGIAPTALAYPIYHYLAVLAAPGPLATGANLSITVKNLDGTVSAAYPYTLPTSLATLDSDGDNLLDDWETKGYDSNNDGVIDIDLPGLGADPMRRDLFVEVDVMQGLTNPPVATSGGVAGTFDSAKAMFAAAPIISAWKQNGINLVLDTSGSVPFWSIIGLKVTDSVPLSTANFYTLKNANFDATNRKRIYHYCIWGSAQPGGYSGVSDINFSLAGVYLGPGDDFMITFDTFPAAYQTLRSQVETFTHELGHDLGQRHGGDNDSQYKPNYLSVMGYQWQLRSGNGNAWRRTHPTCVPNYYLTAGVLEAGGVPPATFPAVIDYSHGMAKTLVENNNSLSESTGVCGLAVDFNADGNQSDSGFNADVDQNGIATDTVKDYPNWRNLDFRGPALYGALVP